MQETVAPGKNNNVPHSSTRKKNNPFELPVVKKVVEDPETARLAERVAGEVRAVAVDAAVGERNLLVHGGPQCRA